MIDQATGFVHVTGRFFKRVAILPLIGVTACFLAGVYGYAFAVGIRNGLFGELPPRPPGD